MFETDKTILGNRTNFEIDLNNKEKLVYNYEIKKRIVEIFVYGRVYAIRKEDAKALHIKDLKSYNKNLYIISKNFLDKFLASNLDIEVKYIKDSKD